MVRNHQDGYPYLNMNFCCCCWQYIETLYFLIKLIGQWISNGDGRRIASDIQKKFNFKTQQKMVTKLEQFTKLGPFSTFQLFKLSKLCYNFLFVLKMVFFISLAIPCLLPYGTHRPIIFFKNIDILLYKRKRKKVTSFFRTLLYISVLHFFVEIIQKCHFFW